MVPLAHFQLSPKTIILAPGTRSLRYVPQVADTSVRMRPDQSRRRRWPRPCPVFSSKSRWLQASGPPTRSVNLADRTGLGHGFPALVRQGTVTRCDLHRKSASVAPVCPLPKPEAVATIRTRLSARPQNIRFNRRHAPSSARIAGCRPDLEDHLSDHHKALRRTPPDHG